MSRVRGFFSGSRGRLVEGAACVWGDVWPIVQSAGAGGVAWFLTHTVLGHQQPFFAPIAAVAALSVNVGERGQRAIGMLLGVVVGVLVGQVTFSLLGTSSLEVALAVFASMLVTRTLISSIIGLIQSGASAALVTALQSTGTGTERILDALIGAGIALLLSQVLFTPSPLSILVDAGREVLVPIAEGLRASVRALADNDVAAAEAALERLSEGRSPLDGLLTEARETSGQLVRRTLRGRWEKGRHLEHLDVRLGEAELLFGSSMLLTRATRRLLNERIAVPEWLSRAAGQLARGAEALAEDPEAPSARRRAHDSALEAERTVASVAHREEPRVALVAEQVRLAASDVLRMAALEEPESEPETEDPGGDTRSGA